MDTNALRAAWQAEEQHAIIGWDFSYLDTRTTASEPPWSYDARAADLMATASTTLDIDTGGGEWLLRHRQRWSPRMVATEHYGPNYQLAVERLGPFGVQVVDVAADQNVALPFPNGHFDLVLNRHGGLNIPEIARVLSAEGTLFTQQVHGQTMHDLLARFGATSQWPNATPETYTAQIAHAGLTVAMLQEHWGTFTFADVGAIVVYLHAIPWFVPNFSVVTHLQPLLGLQAQVDRGEPLQFATGSYLIEARKQ